MLPMLAVFGVGLPIATPAHASPREHSWGFEVTGGWSRYALGAVNDSLASLNRDLGTAFHAIDDGAAYGVAVRMWASRSVLLRLGLERNAAVTTDADRRLDLGTVDLTVSATCYLPLRSPVRIGAAVAAGVVWIRGEFEGSQFSFDTRGSGPDLRVTAEASYPFARGWFVSGNFGWRYAVVHEVKFDEQGTGMRADFSGAVVRVAVGHDWPARGPE